MSKLLFSIEDPFGEEDHAGFRMVMDKIGREKLVIGDDLTTTNFRIITECGSEGLVNAVIIKPNQIGTVSEACAAMKAAGANRLKCIISHRSGETEDNLIIHLARAAGAYGLKIGAPARERIFKFNEFLRIYEK